MPSVHVVWRHLLSGARHGSRRWPSVSALANELEMSVSTVHRSLEHPVEIGAVSVRSLDGLQVLDPHRLLLLLAAHRHLQRDVVRRVTVDVPPEDLERRASTGGAVLGGFGAAVAHLGANWITSYTTVLVYSGPDALWIPRTSGGTTELIIAEPDRRLERYGGVTPFAQAYADIFCMPGWQAARFIEDLDARKVAASDEPVVLV